MEPLLSIAIPTYGAPESVLKNVTRLLSYQNEKVEFLVVDNDETGVQIKQEMLKIDDSRFVYYQNTENIGRSNNVAKALSCAKSDNVLLLSSDDELFFDAIDEIMDFVEKKRPYGIMLGTIITDADGYGFAPKSSGIYRAGSEALSAIPFLGNLMPMVVHKKCINYSLLYNQNEHYMQLRIALTASKKGDLIYLDHVLGRMSANENSLLSTEIDECFHNGYSPEKWDMKIGGNLHYTPQARLMQLKSYLEIVEDCSERRDQRLRVIEKWVSRLMSKCLFAIAQYMSPFSIRVDGYSGHLHYKDVLEQFRNEMKRFFEKREKEKQYFFSGHLDDLIDNELLLIEQGKCILERILAADRIFVYGNERKEKNLKQLLKCMCVDSELIKDDRNSEKNTYRGLVLIPAQSNRKLEKKLFEMGAEDVLFMDRMAKYLGIVWCSEHEGQDYWDEYVAYMD